MKENVDDTNCLKHCSGLMVNSFTKSEKNKNLEELFSAFKSYDLYKKITPRPSGFNGNE